MKLNITTGEINITYEDEYSKLEEDVKKRIIDIIHSLPYYLNYPPTSITSPNQAIYGGKVETVLHNHNK